MKAFKMKRLVLTFLSFATLMCATSLPINATNDNNSDETNEVTDERVVQIALPDENGEYQIYTGDEAQKIYDQIEAETNYDEIAEASESASENDGIDLLGMFTYKYRFVTSSEGKRYKSTRRITNYVCNQSSVAQSMSVSASTSISWTINCTLEGGFMSAFKSKVGASWSNTSSFTETFTLSVPSKKRMWLEFKPLVKYITGESQKYYVSRGTNTTVIAERKQVSSESPTSVTKSISGKSCTVPDGAYIWKEDSNYNSN